MSRRGPSEALQTPPAVSLLVRLLQAEGRRLRCRRMSRYRKRAERHRVDKRRVGHSSRHCCIVGIVSFRLIFEAGSVAALTLKITRSLDPTRDREIDKVPLVAVADLDSTRETSRIPVLNSATDRGSPVTGVKILVRQDGRIGL